MVDEEYDVTLKGDDMKSAVTIEDLQAKKDIAARNSYANYSFYLGATENNMEEIQKINPAEICGVKIFMGSSTGNLLVDKDEALYNIFKNCHVAAEFTEAAQRNNVYFIFVCFFTHYLSIS